jgi:hypothetical protein
MSSNKKRDMEASDDDNEYDEDYEDKGRLHDVLLRKIRILCQRRIKQKNYQKAEDGFDIVEISCKANKMSDKDQLQLGW